jgi:hypothetical protein
MLLFSEIAEGLVWLGKEIVAVKDWIQKVVKTTDEVEKDAATLLPESVVVFEDVEAVCTAAVTTAGQDLSALQTLVAAIEEITANNPLEEVEELVTNAAVQAALTGVMKQVFAKTTYSTLLTAVGKLVTDYDTFGADAKAAISRIEADV